MTIVKQKSSSGFFLVLIVIGFFILLVCTLMPVEQVQAGTILKLDGNKAQTIWYAPGGENPPSGYQLKEIDTIQPGDEIIVRSKKDGTTTFRITIPFMKKYVRVETPTGKTGWIALSIFENKNQKAEIYRPGE